MKHSTDKTVSGGVWEYLLVHNPLKRGDKFMSHTPKDFTVWTEIPVTDLELSLIHI